MNEILTRELNCGLTVVLEPIENVESVGLRWLLPVGSATDPVGHIGYCTLLSELIFRGAGGLGSRAHSDALDRLGVQRASHVLTHHLSLNATLLGERLDEAMDLLVPMALDPALPAEGLDPVRHLCLQSLSSLADDPQQLVMLSLREQHLPTPFNRSGYGEANVLETASLLSLRDHWRRNCLPGGSILSLAGRIDATTVIERLETRLEAWAGTAADPIQLDAGRGGEIRLDQSTAQVHIGVAYDAPREADPESMLERLAVGVLSGSTSARLFTEVRQKRSLCYSVGASYRSGRDHGMVALYAGTTPERAQETLDVSLGEIMRLKEGVEADEFERVVTGIKSQLIMQGESTPARATAIAHDFFRIGRARTLNDLAAEIDAIGLDQLNDYLARRSLGAFTIASIGPVQLESPGQPV